jgi:N-methylhydantoinase A/oxoprolinase/acetone carboxylase beta subunit
LFIGVDVGGTNTDAVLMDGVNLLAKAKLPTTPDVTSGILASLKEVLAQRPANGSIDGVMVGTTHFTNALLERKQLTPTGVVRMSLPATTLLPPLVDWPNPLREAIGGSTYMLHGGHEFDGREISPFSASEVADAAKDMQRKGIQAVAISGIFSPVNPAHEIEAAAIIKREAPGLKITLSHENGRIGLLERENAAALNACLSEVAVRTIQGIKDAITSLGMDAPLYMSQNDGTLMDAEFASRFPVLTISSGPTNSMRGAAFLSGVSDGIVVDIGGTSTDVGALVKGFPREAAVAVRIAGVRTNFRMPDVLSVPLGGGSVIQENPLRIGPNSVGYRLAEEAIVFGGSTLTGTDIAVASGLSQVGNPELLRGLEASFIDEARKEIQRRVETAIDQVKVSSADVPIILVGGGRILAGDSLSGASQVLRPDHGDVANAIGAAIAQVGGQVERVYSLESTSRQDAMADARAEAISKAVAAGANPHTVEVVEIDEVPLTYLPSNATLIRVKAVGDLARHTRG